MKYMDIVKVVADKNEYKDNEVFLGMTGIIISPDIRDNCFYVHFEMPKNIWCQINVADLELVEDGELSKEIIKKELPNPKMWCLLENGFIMNIDGEKKNKIAYDYNS